MSNFELEDTIEDSLNDAAIDTEDSVEVETADATDTDPTIASAVDATEVTNTETETDAQVDSPAGQDPTKPEDDFDKRFGLQAVSVTGKENRIPHSRVRKIIEKNEKDVTARVTKELETKFQPFFQEAQTRIQDYEQRLQEVSQFEQILEKDPVTFLDMLSKVPAYRSFFHNIGQMVERLQGTGSVAGIPQQTGNPADPMPAPDQDFPDGTKGYSMEGLSKLFDWRDRQVESRVLGQAEDRISKRYGPMEQEWKAHKMREQALPGIEKQVAEAKTWPNFDELEPEVIKLLNTDPNISLELAYIQTYNKIIVPKLALDRNKMRSELLSEVQKRPTASAAPNSPVKPVTTSVGPRSIEDIITEEVSKLKQ